MVIKMAHHSSAAYGIYSTDMFSFFYSFYKSLDGCMSMLVPLETVSADGLPKLLIMLSVLCK